MRLLRAIFIWIQVAGATLTLVATLWIGTQALLHLQLLDVQTGSMRPTFAPGDALVVQKESVATLRVGDIVSYHSARNPNELITHRVIRINSKTGIFQTKGDRLNTPDPAVRGSLLAGKVRAILPGLGSALSWLRTWPGLIVCIYLPAAAIGAGELYRLEQHYSKFQPYYLPERVV